VQGSEGRGKGFPCKREVPQQKWGARRVFVRKKRSVNTTTGRKIRESKSLEHRPKPAGRENWKSLVFCRLRDSEKKRGQGDICNASFANSGLSKKRKVSGQCQRLGGGEQ